MGRLTHRTGEGWTYFVTTKTLQSMPVFQVQETADIVIHKMLEYRDKGNFLLHEFVLMPNHLHLILTPANSVSLERAMQLIKGGSSHEIHGVRGNKTQIWQSGFHESRVRDWVDCNKKADYIRFNPVTAKLVNRPEDWPYGSASGKFVMDPIPQGLKPPLSGPQNVGPEGPTPGGLTNVSGASGVEAQPTSATTSGLKPPLSGPQNVGPKGPTPTLPTNTAGASGAKAQTTSALTSELKLRPPKEQGPVGPKGPTPGAPANVPGASGAKAPTPSSSLGPGLKPRPPKEQIV